MDKEEKISHSNINDNEIIKYTEGEKDVGEKSNGLRNGLCETAGTVSTVAETNGKETISGHQDRQGDQNVKR